MRENTGNRELGANGEITVTKAWLPGWGGGCGKEGDSLRKGKRQGWGGTGKHCSGLHSSREVLVCTTVSSQKTPYLAV